MATVTVGSGAVVGGGACVGTGAEVGVASGAAGWQAASTSRAMTSRDAIRPARWIGFGVDLFIFYLLINISIVT
jgi:hypothetical protein